MTRADLSVMQLSSMTATVALEYAALYARLVTVRERLPLRVDDTRDDHESYSDNPNDEPRAMVPEINMGSAIVAVSWPPPPALSAAASDANKQFKDRYGDAGLPFPVQDKQQSAVGDVADTLFVARYIPESDFQKRAYSEDAGSVLVATVGPHDMLRAFAVGLHQWSSARAAGVTPSVGCFGLYRLRYGSWNRESDRRARALDSVFLLAKLKAEILEDVHSFFADETREWYSTHGVPYRRAFLLHGLPGTGKTSLVRALASELRRSCCMLSMSSVAASGEELADALGQLPARPLVVVEDVDAVFSSAGRSKLTFSALLNVLDGLMSAEGVLTVLTTNHPDRLDASAIRAGRVDRTFELGPADEVVLATCFRSFYAGADDGTVRRFVEAVGKAENEVQARSIATAGWARCIDSR